MKINGFKKTTKGYVVSFEDASDLIVPEDIVLEFHLFKGHEIDEATLSKIEERVIYYSCYNLAFKYTVNALKSSYQVTNYLRDKDYSKEVIEEVINAIKKLGIVNDLEFARIKASSLVKKGYGEFYISGYLGEMRISSADIQTALSDIATSDYLEYGKKCISKQKTNYAKYDQAKQSIMLHNYLERRGYSYSIIKNILK